MAFQKTHSPTGQLDEPFGRMAIREKVFDTIKSVLAWVHDSAKSPRTVKVNSSALRYFRRVVWSRSHVCRSNRGGGIRTECGRRKKETSRLVEDREWTEKVKRHQRWTDRQAHELGLDMAASLPTSPREREHDVPAQAKQSAGDYRAAYEFFLICKRWKAKIIARGAEIHQLAFVFVKVCDNLCELQPWQYIVNIGIQLQ